ncbi:hypothetical protein D3C77_585170 [compost metagenome]
MRGNALHQRIADQEHFIPRRQGHHGARLQRRRLGNRCNRLGHRGCDRCRHRRRNGHDLDWRRLADRRVGSDWWFVQMHRNHRHRQRQLDRVAGLNLGDHHRFAAFIQAVDEAVAGIAQGMGQVAAQAPGRALAEHRQLAALVILLLAVQADRVLVQPEQQQRGDDNGVESLGGSQLRRQQTTGIRSLHR